MRRVVCGGKNHDGMTFDANNPKEDRFLTGAANRM
jgi:hypothetical protein